MAWSAINAVARAGARNRSLSAHAFWYLFTAVAVGAVTLLLGLLQDRLPPSRLQMVYLLLVLGLAIVCGRGPAVFASVLAFLSFDWFFVKPVGNLVVNDPMEWFALGLFLVVGISTGTLAAGLKRSAAEARLRGSETAVLYELSIAILSDRSLNRVLDTIVERAVAALGLEAAAILLSDGDDALRLVAHEPASSAVAQAIAQDGEANSVFRSFRRVAAEDAPSANPPALARARPLAGSTTHRASYVPLHLNGRPLGLLIAYSGKERALLPPESLRMLDAFAAQTALAIGRARLAEQEERARAAAESERLKSSFLASISHDLRSPLTAIKTAAALLDSAAERPERAEAKENIDQEVDRLNHLVGNLVEMSRIESGSAPLHLMLEDLTELVGAAAGRFSPLLNGRTLLLNGPADLPPVLLDAVQFDRVLSNLLENAIKFSPPDGAITIEVCAGDPEVLLRIHNRGAAVPPGEQGRLFDRFHRLEARDANPESSGRTIGSGLGLAICKSIVEAHQGRIWTSNEDFGVAFYVALPPAGAIDQQALLSAAVAG